LKEADLKDVAMAKVLNHPLEAVTGVILAGGRSSRMGRDKAWLPWHGHTLLQQITQELLLQVNPLMVVAQAGQHLPQLPQEVDICQDQEPDQGPLRGLHAALQEAPKDRPVFVTGCDYPFIGQLQVGRLAREMGDWDAVVPRLRGQAHPLAGLYQPRVLPMMAKLLAREQRSLHALLDQVRVHWIGAWAFAAFDPRGQALVNINTPEDYQLALRQAILL
jgi:molybdopterin-guanine dinucleotide biosynthesis protein A